MFRKRFKVSWVDGHDHKFHSHIFIAKNEEDAISMLWSNHPLWGKNDFEHWIESVRRERC